MYAVYAFSTLEWCDVGCRMFVIIWMLFLFVSYVLGCPCSVSPFGMLVHGWRDVKSVLTGCVELGM